LWVVDAKGGVARHLTMHEKHDLAPIFSPDGKSIAFSSNRAGKYHLYVMQASGENQRRLTGSGGDDTKPSWSPRLD
jgi:Tol biopolymer transport system component